MIATGVNKERNHPQIVSSEHIKTDCSVHAEIDAIKKVKDASGAVVYVARINRRGEARDSRPCNRCYSTLKSNGVKEIVFTTTNEE